MSIVVLGGSGQLGREIARRALLLGHPVTSIARSPPSKDLLAADWSHKVKWVEADVFAGETWREHLRDTIAVVHTIGIAFESDYKIWLGKSQRRRQLDETYERVNRDSVLIALREAKEAKVPTFVFISAARSPLPMADGYLSSKREAEKALLTDTDPRPVVLRPPLMLTPTTETLTPLGFKPYGFLAPAAQAFSEMKGTPCVGEFGVTYGTVSDATMAAIRDPKASGVYGPQGIQSLASKVQYPSDAKKD